MLCTKKKRKNKEKKTLNFNLKYLDNITMPKRNYDSLNPIIPRQPARIKICKRFSKTIS